MAKDFSNINTDSVYSTIEQATADATEPIIKRRARGVEPTAQEVQEARELKKTQGRAGVRAVRVNMAFTPEVHDYIRTMARVRGETITAFTEHIFRQSMEENAEIYAKAKEFKESL